MNNNFKKEKENFLEKKLKESGKSWKKTRWMSLLEFFWYPQWLCPPSLVGCCELLGWEWQKLAVGWRILGKKTVNIPGILGAVASFIFNTAGKVLGFLRKKFQAPDRGRCSFCLWVLQEKALDIVWTGAHFATKECFPGFLVLLVLAKKGTNLTRDASTWTAMNLDEGHISKCLPQMKALWTGLWCELYLPKKLLKTETDKRPPLQNKGRMVSTKHQQRSQHTSHHVQRILWNKTSAFYN